MNQAALRKSLSRDISEIASPVILRQRRVLHSEPRSYLKELIEFDAASHTVIVKLFDALFDDTQSVLADLRGTFFNAVEYGDLVVDLGHLSNISSELVAALLLARRAAPEARRISIKCESPLILEDLKSLNLDRRLGLIS